jgi:Uma2 family endonuclease
LSPSTENLDRGSKRRIYAAYGVKFLWLLDATAERLEVYELHDAKWLLHETYEDSEEVRAPPFDAISFSLGNLWPPKPPSPST